MAKSRMSLPVQSPTSAPREAQPLLEKARANFGFVPNLLGIFANAPALLEGYMTLQGIFDKTSLTPTERQTVLLATSVENGCTYCVAAHTAIAGMHRVDPDVVRSVREGRPLHDGRLEALRTYARDIVATRGWPSSAATERFLSAGYAPAQALEVVLGVGLKTLSNYANHVADTPLDTAFASAAWTADTAPVLREEGCAP